MQRVRHIASVFALAVAVNYPWEMAQAALYEPMGSLVYASWRCFVASLGDGLTIIGVVIAGAMLYRDATWFRRWSATDVVFTVVAGTLFGVAVEWWGLATGRWEYDDSMPRVPGLGLGLVPLLQMPILASLTLWITAHRFASSEQH